MAKGTRAYEERVVDVEKDNEIRPHYPVMYREVVDLFTPTTRQWFIDCTLGMGGHTSCLLKSFPQARVLALDIDEESLEKARENLSLFGNRVELRHLNFSRLFQEIDLSLRQISGVLIDPGLSIHQLKNTRRGFSHSVDAPPDMRKDRRGECLPLIHGIVKNIFCNSTSMSLPKFFNIIIA